MKWKDPCNKCGFPAEYHIQADGSCPPPMRWFSGWCKRCGQSAFKHEINEDRLYYIDTLFPCPDGPGMFEEKRPEFPEPYPTNSGPPIVTDRMQMNGLCPCGRNWGCGDTGACEDEIWYAHQEDGITLSEFLPEEKRGFLEDAALCGDLDCDSTAYEETA